LRGLARSSTSDAATPSRYGARIAEYLGAGALLVLFTVLALAGLAAVMIGTAFLAVTMPIAAVALAGALGAGAFAGWRARIRRRRQGRPPQN
jgi:membrane protein implicated in regulation of membrane protease activity